jgi:hypothetical protein
MSKDDEYFRQMLCLKDDVGEHPDARAHWPAIFRSLDRTDAPGMKTSFARDIRWVELHTKSGLYVGKTLGYSVDKKRIRTVVQYVVRGLYFTETKYPLENDVSIDVYDEEDIKEDIARHHIAFQHQLMETIIKPLAAQSPIVIGNNVFSYRFHIAPENPVFSVWGLTFYGRHDFLCLTGPPRTDLT